MNLKTQWNEKGKLKVIVVPYHEGGGTIPKTQDTFYRAQKRRCNNAILSEDDPKQGWLIDFDFGDKEGDALKCLFVPP